MKLIGQCSLALSLLPALAVAYTPNWACSTLGKFALPPPKYAHLAAGGDKLAKLHVLTRNVQQVDAVTAASLSEIIEKKEDALVVFYAPWCPHCKNFVMADQHGNAKNAPLELLNKDLVASKGPKVVKFDVSASQPPNIFTVNYVPKIFMLKRSGELQAYKSDPHDLASLKAFAMQGFAPAVAATSANGTAANATHASFVGVAKHASLRH